MKKVLVIHGPNLNLLGEREPEVYGSMTLKELNDILRVSSAENNIDIEFFQSNHEGYILDKMHESRMIVDAILINPGGLTHTSVCLRDAIASIRIPTVEVHLTDIYSRENFRKISLIKEVCLAQFLGKGVASYKDGLNFIINYLKSAK